MRGTVLPHRAPDARGVPAHGPHYLDISGESRLEALARRAILARQRGIMVIRPVGFDVVPSDCLAAHVARRLPAPRLVLGLTDSLPHARLAKTWSKRWPPGVRRGGAITRLPLAS